MSKRSSKQAFKVPLLRAQPGVKLRSRSRAHSLRQSKGALHQFMPGWRERREAVERNDYGIGRESTRCELERKWHVRRDDDELAATHSRRRELVPRPVLPVLHDAHLGSPSPVRLPGHLPSRCSRLRGRDATASPPEEPTTVPTKLALESSANIVSKEGLASATT